MTERELDAISVRAENATPGPWRFAQSSFGALKHGLILAEGKKGGGFGDGLHVGEEEFKLQDADFIAHARADVPALVAALRHAEWVITNLNEQVRYMREEGKRNLLHLADAESVITNLNEQIYVMPEEEKREANAQISRMQKRIETVEVECNRAAEATKRAYAELRQANAKIIGLERGFD